ncbi:hypothetical protein [Vibrio sp. M260121]|uniref:hypothetical protein n=1 Tax=Vibrio sp. M260121 TaxID=3020897 RepID=UPI002F41F697
MKIRELKDVFLDVELNRVGSVFSNTIAILCALFAKYGALGGVVVILWYWGLFSLPKYSRYHDSVWEDLTSFISVYAVEIISYFSAYFAFYFVYNVGIKRIIQSAIKK